MAIPAQTVPHGLRDLSVTLVSRPSDNSTVTIFIHDFALSESRTSDSSLGQEVDFVGQWRAGKNFVLEGWVSACIPGHFMRSFYRGSDVALWGDVSATVSF